VVIGDWLDGRIQVSITEHWFNVFRGMERWNDMAYFYPWHDTLGYNDGYLLYGMFYAGFRALGADPFIAFEFTLGAIRAIGFLACCLFAIDVLGLELGWSILAATVFTLSNSAYIQEGHAQLLAVGFAPLLGWLTWRALGRLLRRARIAAVLWSAAAAALYGAWLLSGFYMAWFMTFFTVLAALAAIFCRACGFGLGKHIWRPVTLWPLLPIAAILLSCIIPFLVVYLPKMTETGAQPFSEVMIYSPSLLDMLHIGPGNWLFGGFDRWMTATFRPGFPDYGENTIGFPPLLAILSGAGVIVALRGQETRPLIWRAIAIGTVLSVVLFVHVRGYTLWYGIYLYVPGARAVRVIARYAIFLALPLTLLAVSFLASRAGRWPGWVMASCVIVLLLEELTYTPSIGQNRAEEVRLLASVDPTPAKCRTFFVSAPWKRASTGRPDVDRLYPHNVDAMLISEVKAVPTINGYSTFNPPDWAFESADRPDYFARVRSYANAHEITGLCGLDVATGRWETNPFP
jgi:hypothetical protein